MWFSPLAGVGLLLNSSFRLPRFTYEHGADRFSGSIWGIAQVIPSYFQVKNLDLPNCTLLLS